MEIPPVLEVEVVPGHSEDMLPWLLQQLRTRGEKIAFVFMDQRGSRYLEDVFRDCSAM